MLTLIPLHHNGSFSVAGGSQSSVPLTLMQPIPAHQLGIVMLAGGCAAGGNGPSTVHGLADDLGSVWTRVAEITRLPENGFRPGVTLSVWMIRPSTTIPAGTVLTGSLGASVGEGIIACDTYDTVSPANAVVLAGVSADDGNTGGVSFPAVTLVPTVADDALWFGVGAFDGDDNVTIPLAPAWTFARGQIGNQGNNFTGLTLFAQYRVVEAMEQTWTAAGASDRSWSMILIAFALQAPIATPVSGTRQFEADFETGTDGVAGASTSRRPDAIDRDFLTAESWGPATLNDPTGGVYALSYQVRAVPGTVYIRRTTGTPIGPWNPETTLFNYSGVPIDELSFCFGADGRPVLVAERATGSAGAPEVWLYWWNPATPGFEFVSMGAGRTPRCCLDAFPHFSLHCAPSPDVQVIYLEPLSSSGLVRFEQREGFAVKHTTPLPYVPNIRLELFCPTNARTMMVKYGRRDVRSGQWTLRTLESEPFDDSLLKRPNFNPYQPSDLTWYRGQLGRNPTSPVTADFLIRGTTVDAVDTIELQCSQAWPSGILADTGFPFNEQVQEAPAPLNAGDSYDFTVTITHGGGSMSLQAFRIRTRKQIGDVTCYSPWRYWFVVSWDDDPPTSEVLVNCGHDALVDVPLYGVVEFGSGHLGSHPCEGEDEVTGGPIGTVFVGGWNPGTGGGWRQDWAWQFRVHGQITFGDPDIPLTLLDLYSTAYFSVGSGGGWPLSNPEQSPLQYP